MQRVFLNYNGVLGLVSVVLGLVLCFFLFRLANKQKHTWFLNLLFLCFTVMMSCFGFIISVRGEWVIGAVYAIILIDVALALLLQFAYHFPSLSRPQEARVVLYINLYAIVLALIMMPYILKFTPDGRVPSFQYWLIGVLLIQGIRLLEFGWVFVVWARKILWIERASGKPHLHKILFPQEPAARTIRAFLLCFSLVLILPFSVILQYLGLVAQDVQAIIFTIGLIIFYAAFFITYINYMPEQSSFMVKLVGTSLLFVLGAVAITGFVANDTVSRDYNRQVMGDLELCRTLVKKEVGESPWELPGRIRYVIGRPLAGGPYATHYARDSNFDPAYFTDLDSYDFERAVEMSTVLQLLKQPSLTLQEARESAYAQVRERTPILGRRLSRLTERQWIGIHEHDVHYDFLEGDTLYQVGYSNLDLLESLHFVNLRLVVLIFAATAGMLLFFPLFFQRNLTNPVRDLLHGVHQVHEGNLNVQVPVHARDEIGYMAQAFNTMVASVAAARKTAVEQERERMRLEAENQRKSRELEEARRLQLSMLPESLPQLPRFTIAAFTNPATEVGGDYYDFHVHDEHSFIAVVGDATGHGLQAGTMVTATKSLFNALAPKHEPVPLLMEVSGALARMGIDGMFMAMMAARFHEGNLCLSAAGMPYALLYQAETGDVITLKIKGLPLGTGFDFQYKSGIWPFKPGDTLLLQSDGLEECFDGNGNILGSQKVLDCFKANALRAPGDIIGELVALGNDWARERSQADDITMVVIQHNPV